MSLKIVFMGTPEFSVSTLKTLHASKNKIVAIYTKPPTKSDRGQKINLSKVAKYAEQNGLKKLLRYPTELGSQDEINFIKSQNPDIGIVVAYGKILSEEILRIPKFGFINIHASLLPKWRGAAPIQRAIMARDSETGISIMKMTKNLDTGPVMLKSKIKLNANTNAEELSKSLMMLSSKEILNALREINCGKAVFKNQNHKEATYAKKIDKEEGKIKWNKNSDEILATINGLYPKPGAWFKHNNARYKILKARITDLEGKPGFVVNNNLTIGCKRKSIQILILQREGRKMQDSKEFLLGNKIVKGEQLT